MSLMKPKWQKLASLAQEICTLWFQFFGAVFASKGYPFKNMFYPQLLLSEPRVRLEGTPLLRPPSQCRQIRPHSFPRFHFHGNEFSDSPQSSQCLAPTSVRPHCTGQLGPIQIPHYSSGIPISQRYPELCR